MEMIKQLPGYGPPAPVPVFQWMAEFEAVLELYRRAHQDAQDFRMLEVGTYHGGTLYHWLQNGFSDIVVSIDSYAAGVDNRHLYDDWKGHNTLYVIEGDSRDPAVIAQAKKHAMYDWIFIDAGHYDHEVRADWENYRPMVVEGGTVLFHDILPPTAAHPEIEVAYLWEEIKQRYRTLEVVQNRYAEWGGIGVVLL